MTSRGIFRERNVPPVEFALLAQRFDWNCARFARPHWNILDRGATHRVMSRAIDGEFDPFFNYARKFVLEFVIAFLSFPAVAAAVYLICPHSLLLTTERCRSEIFNCAVLKERYGNNRAFLTIILPARTWGRAS